MATQAATHNDYVHGHQPGANGYGQPGTNGYNQPGAAGYDQPGTTGYGNHVNYDAEANNGVPGPAHNLHRSNVSQGLDHSSLKVANPGPLGLISFALTTFVMGFYLCGVGLPGSNSLSNTVGPSHAIFGLAIFFGGAAQFIAGILHFRVGNTFGCTVHCSYGAFWLSFAMFLIPSLGIRDEYAGNERAYSVALGIFLIAWFLLTLLFIVAALKTNIALLILLSCLAMAFFLVAIAQFVRVPHPTGATRVNRAGGAFAIMCGLVAFYAGSAGMMTSDTTWVRFPLGELSRPVESTKHSAKSRQ